MIGNIWFTFVGFFEQVLMLFATLTGSMALGIILFTICARLIILPLTLKSIKSSRKMQEVQPLIKEIQRKHGKDQKRMTEETMKLYQEHKINPVGGCLPMLLQLPIFIGVYQAIIHLMLPDYRQWLGTEMRAAVIDNNIEPLLSQPMLGPLWELFGLDSPNVFTELLQQSLLGINLGLAPFADGFSEFRGFEYLILPVLSVGLQVIQQQMAMPRVQDPQQKMMTQMMMFMPLIFAYIALTFPAGAVLYWVTSSVVGIIQQYFISGWGSLANHLKFLPADTRGRSSIPSTISAVSDTAADGAVNEGDADAAPARERPTFWDVLRPLTESDVPALATAGAAAGIGNEESSELTEPTAPTEADRGTDHATEQARRQGQPPVSRRQRRRR
jgi:YidC/Oxa1 family membrane protein insertase